MVDRWGDRSPESQIAYDGSRPGTAQQPVGGVTYVDAHDNEILFDMLAVQTAAGTRRPDRARMNSVLALAITALGPGPEFWHAGTDLLRSKSLDRNSFNSGDWFNQIRWDLRAGQRLRSSVCRRRADNQDKWPYARPLLADPSLVPDCAAIDLADRAVPGAAAHPPLLAGLRPADRRRGAAAAGVPARPARPETPGVLTMTLDGRGLDRRWKSVTVVFNGTPATADADRDRAARERTSALHPVLAGSADPVLRTASFERASGTFTVPARSVAVFVQKRVRPAPFRVVRKGAGPSCWRYAAVTRG